MTNIGNDVGKLWQLSKDQVRCTRDDCKERSSYLLREVSSGTMVGCAIIFILGVLYRRFFPAFFPALAPSSPLPYPKAGMAQAQRRNEGGIEHVMADWNLCITVPASTSSYPEQSQLEERKGCSGSCKCFFISSVPPWLACKLNRFSGHSIFQYPYSRGDLPCQAKFNASNSPAFSPYDISNPPILQTRFQGAEQLSG